MIKVKENKSTYWLSILRLVPSSMHNEKPAQELSLPFPDYP